MTKFEQAQRAEAVETLRKILKPGDKVHTILRNVSRSGMSRRIDLYKMEADGPRYLSGYVATAMGERRHKDGGIIVGGCGMDMGFHLVYSLSRTLFPDGFGCVGDRETTYVQNTAEECAGAKYHDQHPDCDHKSSYTSRAACPSNDHSNGDRDYTPHGPNHKHWHDSDGGYALRHEWL